MARKQLPSRKRRPKRKPKRKPTPLAVRRFAFTHGINLEWSAELNVKALDIYVDWLTNGPKPKLEIVK